MRTSAGSQPTAPEQIRAYFDALPSATRKALAGIRTLIRSAAPGAAEHFSYGIPGFRLDGKPLLWYAGWKEHLSLYPITAGMRVALGDALTRYAASRGTIRIPLDGRIPVGLIRGMVKARVKEIRVAAPARARKRAAAGPPQATSPAPGTKRSSGHAPRRARRSSRA